MRKITLHDLRELPERDPRIRAYIRALSPLLEKMIRRGRRARATGDGVELATVASEYADICDRKGCFEPIEKFLDPNMYSVRNAAVKVLHAIRTDLKEDTILRYRKRFKTVPKKAPKTTQLFRTKRIRIHSNLLPKKGEALGSWLGTLKGNELVEWLMWGKEPEPYTGPPNRGTTITMIQDPGVRRLKLG